MRFAGDRSNGIQWTVDSEHVLTQAWHTVIRQFLNAKYGAKWPEYKEMARLMLRRTRNLHQAAQEFGWLGSDHRFPVGVEPADWVRLTALLRRIGGEIDETPSLAPIPEFDAEYFAALKLVRSRTNIAISRFEIAVAAIENERGKPRGGVSTSLARALRQRWEIDAGRTATVTGTNERPAGPFVDYCFLARGLLPEAHHWLLPLTEHVIAEATRKKLGKPPPETPPNTN